MRSDRPGTSPRVGHAAPDGWEQTRAQTALATRFVGDADDYLAAEKQDVGRLTATDLRELFVSCDPAQALQQQFEHLQPEFIAVHDIATSSSRKLLIGVAAASGRRLQRLVIRRQGYGNVLAALEFVELPTEQGPLLRMYSTDADADTAARHAIAHALIGFSRLGAVMVGDLAPHAMAPALRPLREAIGTGPWPNRQLILLPLAAASTLIAHATELGQGRSVNVRTTPQVTRPADAWRFINASWSRLGAPAPEAHRQAGAEVAAPRPAVAARPVPDVAVERPMTSSPIASRPPEMRPMPTVRPPDTGALPDVLERYVEQLGGLTGMLGCCVFDVATSRAVAHAGTGPVASQLAIHGAQLLSAMGGASRALGFGRATPDAAITVGDHHLLLRAVPNHPGLALHAVLDKTQANLTLARLQIQRMDALFDEVAAGSAAQRSVLPVPT